MIKTNAGPQPIRGGMGASILGLDAQTMAALSRVERANAAA